MLTLERARKMLVAAESEAVKLGITVTVVVVDESGHLIAAGRMDGALPVSPRFAAAKAYTAATVGLPTADIAKYTGPGQPYYGFSDLDPRFTGMAGGLPVKEEGRVVGGIGVGGSYDTAQDTAVAQAALALFG